MTYPAQLHVLGPQYYDAADHWGIRYSVVARHNKYPVEPFNAPAFAPAMRIVEEVVRQLPVGEVWSLVSRIRGGMNEVAFECSARRLYEGEDIFEFTYQVTNNTQQAISGNWLSVIDPEFSNGYRMTVEPGGTARHVAKGASPILVNDIAILLPGDILPEAELEQLGSEGTWEDRILGGFDESTETKGLIELNEPRLTITMAPALGPKDWIRR